MELLRVYGGRGKKRENRNSQTPAKGKLPGRGKLYVNNSEEKGGIGQGSEEQPRREESVMGESRGSIGNVNKTRLTGNPLEGVGKKRGEQAPVS